jgi:hypothetical protein
MKAPSPTARVAAGLLLAGASWAGCNALAGIESGVLVVHDASTSDVAPAVESAAPDAGGEDGSSDDAGPITGKQILYSVSLSGAAAVPADFSMTAPAATVVLPDGGLETYPGTGDGQGNFTIEGVPAGASYYLAVEGPDLGQNIDTYVFTDLRRVDLSEWTLGRTDELNAEAGVQTSFVMNATGLVPWSPNDRFQLGSANLGNWQRLNMAACPDGGTSCTVDYPDWEKVPNPFLIDPTRNDDTYVLQHRFIDGGTVSASISGYTTGGFALAQGVVNTLDASLAPAPQVTTSVSWDHDAFKQLGASINPTAEINRETLQILASPTPFTQGVYGYGQAPILGNDARTGAQIGSGTQAESTTMVDPFPPSWPLFVYVDVGTEANVVLPASAALTGSFQEEGNVNCSFDASKLPTPLAPAIGPVQQPLIGTQDAFKAQTGVGITPVLAWKPPALGTPTRYLVTVWKLVVSQKAITGSSYVARMVTQSTQVQVPPGVLVPGGFYYFKFQTSLQGGTDPGALLAWGSPNCGAAAVSGVVTP